MKTIVVGVDGSPHAQAALQWAADEARLRHAHLRAVHVWQPPLVEGYPYTGAAYDPEPMKAAASALLDTAVAEVEGPDLKLERIVVCGSAAASLLDHADDADLVVVGCRGRGGFAGLVLGSVSQQIAHHARCPVVIVRS